MLTVVLWFVTVLVQYDTVHYNNNNYKLGLPIWSVSVNVVCFEMFYAQRIQTVDKVLKCYLIDVGISF